jgi:hypothetical protein
LSPSGLELNGVQKLNLKQAEEFLQSGAQAELRGSLSGQLMPLANRPRLTERLQALLERCRSANVILESAIEKPFPEDKIKILKSSSYFGDLFHPLFSPLFEFYERAPEKVQRSDIDKFLGDLSQVLSLGLERNRQFLDSVQNSSKKYFEL